MPSRITGIDDEQLRQLQALLRECTARIEGTGGATTGTGFFIDADLLLTCAHVAKGAEADKVKVFPQSGKERSGTILHVIPNRLDDVALVKVEIDQDAEPQPAVALGAGFEMEQRLSHWGYPPDDLGDTKGVQHKVYSANPSLPEGGGIDRWIIQAGDDLVRAGQSGGALLGHHSGAVVGLMQYAKSSNEDINAGGGGIPVERAMRHMEQVRQCAVAPPPATNRWRTIFGQPLWESRGWTWGNEEILDLYISGSPSSWKVAFAPGDDACDPIKASALPENISEALFAWAQSKRLTQREDIELLGSLLGAAMFPEPVLDRLRKSIENDHLLIRVHFDEATSLADVPWEFASVEVGRRSKLIGVERNVSFVRVSTPPDQVPVATMPPDTRFKPACILSVTISPENWYRNRPKEWPSLEDLNTEFQRAVSPCRHYRSLALENPRLSELDEGLEQIRDTIDIVHYTGFGNYENGVARIAFSDGFGGEQLQPLDDFFAETLRSVQPRLFIMHFLAPPFHLDYQPIPPSAFRKSMRGNLNALVYTRRHMHPSQTNPFNLVFYKSLSRGETVERAVQLARRTLLRDRPDDPACFGAFSLLTGPTSHMRFGYKEEEDDHIDDRGNDASGQSRPVASQRPKLRHGGSL